MTIDVFLQDQVRTLQAAGIETARLDVLVLLCDSLKKDKAWLLAHPEYTLPPTVQNDLLKQLARRAQHVPLAYIRGKSEFYGREFFVNESVLEPRPESESCIEVLKDFMKSYGALATPKPTIIDVGTGSGALATTAALEVPGAQVFGTDISLECLEVAVKNAAFHKADVAFIEADLVKPQAATSVQNFSVEGAVLLCNLPYVPVNYDVNRAATHEPALALYGGYDGLDLFRQLFKQLDHAGRPAALVTESLTSQHEALAALAHKHDYELQTTKDLIQLYTPTGSALPLK